MSRAQFHVKPFVRRMQGMRTSKIALGILVFGLGGCLGAKESTPACMFAEVENPRTWVFCPSGINATFNCAGLACPSPGQACDIGIDDSVDSACEP